MKRQDRPDQIAQPAEAFQPEAQSKRPPRTAGRVAIVCGCTLALGIAAVAIVGNPFFTALVAGFGLPFVGMLVIEWLGGRDR